MQNRSITWLTNIPTPYRLPLWRALRELADVSVVALAASEANREWNGGELARRAHVRIVNAPKIFRGAELTLYGPNIRLLRALPARRTGALVIDGWESPAYVAAMLFARLRQVPLVLSYRGTSASHKHGHGPVNLARRWLFRQAGCILTGGPASTEAVCQMGIPRSRIVEGINVVDVEGIAAAASGLRLSTAKGHTFLAVGQLVERKNIGALIDAFASIRESDDKLHVVGSGPLAGQLVEQVNSLHLDGSVTFSGHQEGEHLMASFAQGDTLVLSSLQEVYGLVVPEALAAGCHAVISSSAGCSDSLKGMRGVFVADPTSSDLGRAMRESRMAWQGPITKPDILGHTPQAAAARVMEAVGVASAGLVKA